VLRTQLADIGLEVQIDPLQQAAWTERWEVSDFDWINNGSVVDADPDDNLWNFFYSEGPWNKYSYSNADVDEMLEQTRTTADQAARAELFQGVRDILQEDVGFAFLYHTRDITGFYNYVQGYQPIPEMRYLETVWLDQ
jgi:peptide/nickel transport system substrate-binding protein